MKYLCKGIFLSLISLFINLNESQAQTLAFPGAEGFGKYVTGGRGGAVYHVTNLNNDGPGSFRDAVSQSNRIVVFDVGGVIEIDTRIVISKNITIAGQTAPGGGITIYGNGIALTSSSGNDIIRYIRIRMGKNGDSGKDAVGISGGAGYMFDHVSISWGRDGTLDLNGSGVDNCTFQDCIISQGINNSNHSTGGLMQSGKWSVIRSLYIDNKTRNPKARGTQEFINSVLYNWATNGFIMGDTQGASECNMIGNYFIYGPSSDGGSHFTRSTPQFKIYGEDNWIDLDKDGTLNGSLIDSYLTATEVNTPFTHSGITDILSASDALNYLIENVGASKVRDAVDSLLIEQLTSYGTKGAIINTEDDNNIPNNVGTVANGLAPLDIDQDGMPDEWEMEFGFNPNSKNDQNLDTDGDGYTNIEEYINGTDPGEGDGYTPEGAFFIEAQHSALDVVATDSVDGSVIEQKAFNKNFLQAWVIESVDTLSSIINKASGLALTVKNASVADGDTIIQTSYSGSDDQLWYLKYQKNGSFSIINKNSNLALTVSEGSIDENIALIQRAYVDSAFQKYKLISFAKYYNPPIVEVSSPLTGNVFLSNEDVLISADASDLDGAITKVEFFDGDTIIGEVSEAPYNISFNGAIGNHDIHVKATDNDGLVTQSNTVTISIIDGNSGSIYIQENDTGFCSVNGTIDTDNDGFSGDGFINTDNFTGAGIDFKINVPADGVYALKVRYANGGGGSRPGKLLVNEDEAIANIDLPATGDWAIWAETSFSATFTAGENDLRIEATTGDGLANIDYLEVLDSLVIPVVCTSEGSGGEGFVIQENDLGFCEIDGSVDNDNAGFTGTGFGNTDNATGKGIDWKISVASTGVYTLNFQYANGGGSNRPGKLIVDGTEKVSNIDLNDTGGWTVWAKTSTSVSLSEGKHSIRLEATTSGGLSNIDYIEFVADDISGTSCVDEIPDGLATLPAKGLFNLFPNPVKNQLDINIIEHGNDPALISVYNMEGVLVHEQQVYADNIQLNITDFRAGIYLIKLQTGNTFQTMRFLKD